MKRLLLFWMFRGWILILFSFTLSPDLEGQTNCGNISVSITTVPTTRVYDNDGSYTIHISGGPGTYIVSTENGETEDPDPYFCQIFGDCDPQPVIQLYTITLTQGHTLDSVRIEYLNGGTYHIRVDHDSSGCHLQQDVLVESPPCDMELNVSHTDVTAVGADNGTISVNPTQFSGFVKMNLYKGFDLVDSARNAHTFSGLSIGHYVLYARDSVDCYRDMHIDIEGSFCDIQISPTEIISPTWGGGADGSITINGTSVGGLIEVKSTGLFSPADFFEVPHTFDHLFAGEYSFYAIDASGCTTTLDPVFIDPPPCNFSTQIQTQNANNGVGGIITVHANSPAGNYLLVIKDQSGVTLDSLLFDGDISIGGFTPGTYQIYVAEALFEDDFFEFLSTFCETTTYRQVGNTVDCSTFNPVAQAVDVSAYGAHDGQINVSSSGGHGQVQIVLNGDCEPEIFGFQKGGFRSSASAMPQDIFNSGTFTGLDPGDYHICFFDAAGCESIQYVTVGSASCTINTSITPTQPSTNQSNGSIAVTASIAGSTEDVRIFIVRQNYGTYLDGFNAITAYNLPEGNYEINCFGQNGQYCSKSEMVVLNDGLDCDVEINVGGITNVSAYGANDGTLSASASSSHGVVTLSLAGQSFTGSGTFNGLGPGSYNVIAVDEAGCTTQSSGYYISTPRCGIQINVSTILPSPGQFNGRITVTASGVPDPIYITIAVPSIFGFITIAGGTNSCVVNNLGTDYYIITAYTDDYQNCSAGASIYLPNTCVLNAFATPFNASGPYNNDGMVIVGANGGTGYYSISGPGTQTYGNTFSGLAPGTYTYTVTDLAAGCSSTVTATVSSPGCFVLAVFKQDVTDYGGTDGYASIYYSDGASSGDVTYQLRKNGVLITTYTNNSYFTGLDAGNYSVSASDEVGCNSSVGFVINQPDCTFDTTVVIHAATLHGASNGSVMITATGGLGNVNIKLQSQLNVLVAGPLPSPANFNNLPAGIYQVMVYDEVACSTTFNITINQPSCNLQTAVYKQNVSIHGGQNGRINITANNGIAPYLFTLLKNGLSLSSKQSNDSTFFDLLSAGTYIVQTSDGSDCAKTDTIVIIEPSCIPVNTSFSIFACNTYSWGGTVYSASGIYSHLFQSISGCDSTVTLNLTIGHSSQAQVTISICNSYNWFGQDYNQSGDYTHSLLNASGCDSTITLHLTIKLPTSSSLNVETCSAYNFFGTVYSASGTYSHVLTNAAGCDSTITLHLTIYSTSNTTSDLSVCGLYVYNGVTYSIPGSYTIASVFASSNGCDSTVVLNLHIIQGSTSIDTVRTCTSYSWHGMNLNQSGIYSDTVTSSGCTSIDILNLTILNTTSSSQTISVCGQYTWNGTTYTSTGTYSFHTTNTQGCDSTATLILTIATPVTYYLDADHDLHAVSSIISCTSPGANYTTTILPIDDCNDSNASIHPGALDNNCNDIDENCNGTPDEGYVAGNCTSCLQGVLSSTKPSPPTASSTSQPTCSLPTGIVTVSNPTSGHTYSFDDGATYQSSRTKSGLNPGTYRIKVKSNATLCESDASIVIINEIPASPSAPVASTTKQPSCAIPTGTITVSNPTTAHTYSFNNGVSFQNSRVLDSLAPGTYLIKVKSNTTGCISDATSVVVDPVPTTGPSAPTASVTKQPTCAIPTGTITVSSPTSGHTYSFNNGNSFQSSRVLDSLAPGTYLIKIKSNATGCISDATPVVVDLVPTTGPAAPTASTTKQPNCIIPTGTITVSSPTSGHTYSFNNGNSFQSSRVLDSLAPGAYLIKIKSNATGCISEATSVIVNPIPTTGPASPIASATKQPTCAVPTGTITVSNPTSGNTYSFNDGISFQNSRVLDSLAPGTYLIKVKSNATGCISDATPVVVDPVPTTGPAAPTASTTKQPNCIIPTGTITVSSPTSGHTYSFNNGVSFQSSRVLDSLAPGTYLIKVKSNTTGCISDATPVIVDPVPTTGPAAPTASTTKQPNCIIPTGTITVSSPSSGHTYSFNNGVSFQSSRVLDSLVPGTYLIKVKSNATGCISEATPVVVDPIPTTGPAAPTASTTKQPNCIIPTGTITVSSPTSGHTYSFNNGVSFQSSRVMDSLDPGTYLIKIKSNTTGCISDATSVVVDPVPTSGPAAPTASVTKQPTCAAPVGTITVSNPTTGHTYSFDNGLSFQSSRVKAGLTTGIYIIIVKSNVTGCVSDGISITIDSVVCSSSINLFPLGHNPIKPTILNKASMSIFPNPSNDQFSIRFDQVLPPGENFDLMISDQLGRIHYQHKYSGNELQYLKINSAGLENGNYIIRLYSKETILPVKILTVIH